MPERTKKRLGEILKEAGIINEAQLQAALQHQRTWRQRLGTALVAKGFLTEEMLMRVLGSTLKLPIVDISHIRVSPDVIKLVPARLAEKFDFVPIAVESKGGGRRTLIVAMADPLNLDAIDQIKFVTGMNVRTVLSTITGIAEAMRKYYGAAVSGSAPLHARGTADRRMTIVHQGDERDVEAPTDPGADDEPTADDLPSFARRKTRKMTTTRAAELDGAAVGAELKALVTVLLRKGVITKAELREALGE